jgi:hypothetical protein
MPNFARKPMPTAIPALTNGIKELYPQQTRDHPQGWGLTFMLTLDPTPSGRGPNTASWCGLANSYWWIDRQNGVGGFVSTQILPFAGMFNYLPRTPTPKSGRSKRRLHRLIFNRPSNAQVVL